MKKISLIFLMVLLPLCCAQAAAQTVGPDISAEDITDFYYTYSWVGYNAEYVRYRFYTEDGKFLFFHETRGTKDDYGWNTEDDIISSGTAELAEEQWEEFFALLEGGTVTERSDEVIDGDSGPWTYLYWKGDGAVYQEYAFPSVDAREAFVEFCEGLAPAEEPMTEAALVSCEYSVYGGMENENITCTMQAGDSGRETRLVFLENGKKKERILPRRALEDLAEFLAGYHPEKWKSLPGREFFALDAPDKRIELKYEDGMEYAVGSGRETGGTLFRETECFMQSYFAEDAQTFELTFESFYGGGPEFSAVLSAPEIVRVEEYTDNGEASEPVPPGSSCTVHMVFHGRIPGQTELRIEEYGPLTPVEDVPQTVYVLNVDDDYNVTLLETREE